MLGQQLEYFRLIRKPYRPGVEKDFDPPNQDLGSLYGFHLCLYYNNHINIDTIEAWCLFQLKMPHISVEKCTTYLKLGQYNQLFRNNGEYAHKTGNYFKMAS